ncbi:MAG: hypothetical protein ABEL97_14330 [Salinibacter sp.]
MGPAALPVLAPYHDKRFRLLLERSERSEIVSIPGTHDADAHRFPER